MKPSLVSVFGEKKRGGAYARPRLGALRSERTQRRSSGRKAEGRPRDVSTEFDRNFPRNLFARTMAWLSNKDKSTFLSPLHRSTLTFIGSRARRQSLSSSSHPCVTVDSVKSSLGMISKRDPLPFLCYAIGRRLARLLSETISAITRRQFHAFNISNFSILYFSSIRVEYDPIED